jgi:hypothetical protein
MKKCSAFGHAVHFAGEAETAKIIEEVLLESARAPEPIDLSGGEAKVLEKIERLMQPGGEQERTPCRQGAHEQFEHGHVGVAMIQVGLIMLIS